MKRQLLVIGLLCSLCIHVSATAGDTAWVQAQRDVWMDWYNDFDTAVQFPDGTASYRKIEMIFTLGKYACPGSPQYCSDWDYTVQVFVMTPGGDTLELGRLITPYAKGARMPADWKGTYVFDVTDYYPVLKDNATVRVHYSGYSGGFTADVRFAFVEGTRTRDVLRIDRLWHGSFDYGNAADPIENKIAAVGKTVPAGTDRTELKFCITGHGGDDVNCAEFCKKDYRVLVNSSAVAQRSIWRDDCGLNALYPQSGTWIYNRANWCPGDLVLPDAHRLAGLHPGDAFNIDVDFDSHNSTTNQPNRYPASYMIEAALFHYGPLHKSLDVSLEDIVAPTDADRHFRENARCGGPVVRISNTGQTPVTSVRFAYGVDGTQAEYLWQGTLAPLEATEVTLAELQALSTLSGETASRKFTVRITEVNGSADADMGNNEMTAVFTPAPKWPTEFIVSLKTNSSMTGGKSQSSWAIYDRSGAAVKERNDLSASTVYTDTVRLGPGCYRLEVRDAGCDGLSWWANAAAGNGTFTVRPLASATPYTLRGYFNGDFGCGFTQYFTADWPTSVEEALPTGKAELELYPNPAQHAVHVAITGMQQVAGTIRVLDVSGRIVARQPCHGAVATINTSSFADGMYTVVFMHDHADRAPLQGRFIVNKAN